MSKAFLIHQPDYNRDHAAIAANGMGYTRASSGFYDILKRGYPEPHDPRTVLLELKSPQCLPVLWATETFVWIPVVFVARQDFIDRLQSHGVTGFETCPVEVVKVASRGKRSRAVSGEPEDQIVNRANLLETVRDRLPPLRGVIITGRLEVKLRFERTNEPTVQPYVPASELATDLCVPCLDGERYGGHVFCTQRFMDIVDREHDNVAFTSFDDWAARMWPQSAG